MRTPCLFALILSFAACATSPFASDTEDLQSPPPDESAGGPSVMCTSTPCSTASGHVCCVSQMTYTASCIAGPCPNMSYSYACDGPEDCGGLRCCFSLTRNGSACASDCGIDYRLCHTPTDCSSGQICSQLEWGPPSLSACYKP